VVVSHDIVSNAFKLLAALAFVPIMLSIGRNLRIVDEAPPSLMPSDWTVELSKDHGGGGLVRRDFHELLGREPRQGEDLLVSWPNGWHRRLVVTTAPFEDGSGRVGGAVAAFIEREPWSPASVV